MVTTLSKLVEMTQGRAIPAWLREEVLNNKDAIAQALREKGIYVLSGPNGEKITIEAEKRAAVAA